jgi:hypothetical protein
VDLWRRSASVRPSRLIAAERGRAELAPVEVLAVCRAFVAMVDARR